MKATVWQVGRKLFDPQRHLWLRATPQSVSSATNAQKTGTWRVDVGLTARKLENIGDIVSIKMPTVVDQQGLNRPLSVKLGEPVLFIEWEGAAISAADELYHTVWETIIDEEPVESPLDGSVETVYDRVDEELDEDTIVLQMMANTDSIYKAFGRLVEESKYEEVIKHLGPGKFQD